MVAWRGMFDQAAALIARLPLDPQERAHRLDVATRLSHDCGCEAGGVFLVVALVLAVGWFVQPGNTNVPNAALGVAAVFTAALAGKAIGIGFARLRLWLVLRALQRWPVA